MQQAYNSAIRPGPEVLQVVPLAAAHEPLRGELPLLHDRRL